MCLCQPDSQCLLHPFASSHGNVWHCVCIPVTLILLQHLGKNVYMHQYMHLHLPDSHVCFTPLVYLHGHVGYSVWHCVCVFQSLYFCPHTLFRMCTCINTCIDVHLTPCLLHPVCILHVTLPSSCIKYGSIIVLCLGVL